MDWNRRVGIIRRKREEEEEEERGVEDRKQEVRRDVA